MAVHALEGSYCQNGCPYHRYSLFIRTRLQIQRSPCTISPIAPMVLDKQHISPIAARQWKTRLIGLLSSIGVIRPGVLKHVGFLLKPAGL